MTVKISGVSSSFDEYANSALLSNLFVNFFVLINLGKPKLLGLNTLNMLDVSKQSKLEGAEAGCWSSGEHVGEGDGVRGQVGVGYCLPWSPSLQG
jgi:hypothetical protein